MRAKIIAEIGQNFDGSLSLAKELICAASESGADVAKFQVFDAKALFSQENNPWYEYNLRNELNFGQLEELAQECINLGIEFMASAFDPLRVSWLESLGVKSHKLASRSIGDKQLSNAMLSTGKPVLVSLGMWKEKSFPNWLKSNNTKFLHCISEYPTPLNKVKLGDINFMEYAGFSDHTIGIEAAFIAIARGARIIEKHFTLDKNAFGPDHKGSMDPEELLAISKFARSVDICL